MTPPNDAFSDFTNLYQLQKTLRFELKPIPREGETPEEALDRLTSSPFFKNDERRENAYAEVKTIIDDFFRDFIDTSLRNIKTDWEPLAKAIDSKNEKAKQQLNASLRATIVKSFGSTKEIFGKDLFEKRIPEWLRKQVSDQRLTQEECEMKQKKLTEFKGFTTYFSGFWENRENLFSDKEQHTAIAFRIVHENFPRFYGNIKAFKNAPQEIQEEFFGKFPVTLDAFNSTLTQAGIDSYNKHIGGERNAPSGEEKGRGFNERINQWNQTHKEKKVQKMKLLYKQILSDRESAWSGKLILDKQDLTERLKKLHEELFKKKNENGETAIDIAVELFASLPDFDFSKIWFAERNVPALALSLFGQWDTLNSELRISEGESDSKGKQEKLFSLQEIEEAIKSVRKNHEPPKETPTLTSLLDFFKTIKHSNDSGLSFAPISKVAQIAEKELNAAIRISEQTDELLGNDAKIAEIKSALDRIMDIFHKVKILRVQEKLLQTKELDTAFYAEFENAFSPFSSCASVYDSVRNYLTKKPYSTGKMKLCFDSPTLANGWDENKIPDYRAFILRKDGKYFLGLLNGKSSAKERKTIIECEATIDESQQECYERMIYKYLPSPVKMLPKIFFSKKGVEAYKPAEELIDKSTRNTDVAKLVRFYQNAIPKYNNGDYQAFSFTFKKPEGYSTVNEFYGDVERQNYRLGFKKVPVGKIKEFIENDTLFLFEIYNKDFSDNSGGRKNLHTLYWLSAFSSENRSANFPIKLNGEAEIFWRTASKSLVEAVIHKTGSVLVNRRDSEGKTIPEKAYLEIYRYKNGKLHEDDLSEDAKKRIESGKIVCKKASYETRKDRRYTEDKLFFHIPLTFNRTPKSGKDISPKELNERTRALLCNNAASVKIIGIDRGERNLISLVMIDGNGKILLQKSFNEIEESSQHSTRKTDYQDLLKNRETERQEARKSWKTIGKIAELKEGYISQVVHAISKLVVEHNAIVVLEDLNIGFKRGRFKVERQIYQKFERALIEKLNFLVFKDRKEDELGGVLNALQLTNKFESFEKLGNQSGILFYVPAGYTSKIDPKTGFVNIFDLSGITNTKAKKELFSKFSRIYYSEEDDAFAFEFDYSNPTLKTYAQPIAKTKWTVYSHGKRLVWNPKTKKTEPETPTQRLKEALGYAKIDWRTSENLVTEICEVSEEGKFRTDFWDKLFRAFKFILQMRNSLPGETESDADYLISPVKGKDGTFFNSCKEADKKHPELPIDADSNGAYHIALKGLMGIHRKFAAGWQKNESWFRFIQYREFEK